MIPYKYIHLFLYIFLIFSYIFYNNIIYKKVKFKKNINYRYKSYE